jgi:hypothetical protein
MIPEGWTSLRQPVDIGVNKPFKNRIRQQWEQWMIAEGLANGMTSLLTRENIIEWTRIATNNLPEQMVQRLGGMASTPGFHQLLQQNQR